MTVPRDSRPTLVWFRDDLRTGDHPALAAAVGRGAPVAALYVLDDGGRGPRPLGAAARWKLHGALAALARDLDRLRIPLILKRGDARRVVPATAEALGAGAVAWSRRYEPAAVECDTSIMAGLKSSGVDVQSCAGSLLVEPWRVAPAGGGFYKVFTPFMKAARAFGARLDPIGPPPQARPWPKPPDAGDALKDWGLRPTRPDWAGGLRAAWAHGETGARARLEAFVEQGFGGYRDGRDRPGAGHVSMLSPHLRFGEVSPRQARQAAWASAARAHGARDADFEAFERELYWRDFCHNLLFSAADLAGANVQAKFDRFPWREDEAALEAWRRGRTGYPIVDAGMRQLWETGWMHNRVRMAAASFLTKHLLIDWRQGERWFWDTLVDADAASNPANWQWVAGSGADAAPYFRIFNPVTQGRKFDPDGAYVRRWVPELARLPDRRLHAPWTASAEELADAGVRLGRDYAEPIVEHDAARRRALAAYDRIKGG